MNLEPSSFDLVTGMMPLDAKISGAGSMFDAVVGEYNTDSDVFKNN